MITNCLNRFAKPIAWMFYILLFGSTGYGYTARAISGEIPIIRGRQYMPAFALAAADRSFIRPPEINLWEKPATKPRKTIHTPDFGGGPSQPEMQAFQSVNANNMVDLFSGDFSYNIPLMDVGGYPLNLAYRGGISMDQEASWVGLGWNINPGTITRNLRGLPDDFDGNDSIKKISSVKPDKTVGVTGGGSGDVEVVGFPINAGFGASFGIFHNSYKGWGLEKGINASINSGSGTKSALTGGLSLSANDNSQNGLELTPSLSIDLSQKSADEASSVAGTFSTSLPYNSRSGLKGLQLAIGERQSQTDIKNQKAVTYSEGGSVSSMISFASPAYSPTISLPITSQQFSFTAKVGLAEFTFHPSYYISGYASTQLIASEDTLLALPAYGYLHYQDGANNNSALMDFNREKELVYREYPPMPHIAVPIYTYDAFSITGEGTGGMFRAYRGDIGYVHDHFMRTKDASDRVSVDVGVPNLVHSGVDLNLTRAFTQSGAWDDQNSMRNLIQFKRDSAGFEAAYFRNPGEKSINSKSFYDAIGGDDVVAVKLFQPTVSSSVIQATNFLTHYRNYNAVADSLMTPAKAIKPERDKRSEVISYLTAKEADAVGLSKYIENYTPNQFGFANCNMGGESLPPTGAGLPGQYFTQEFLTGNVYTKPVDSVAHNWNKSAPTIPVKPPDTRFPADKFSIRWAGRVKAPVTGTYVFQINSDDGSKFWLDDSLLANQWNTRHGPYIRDTVNLVAGEFYNLKVEYFEEGGYAQVFLKWQYSGQSMINVPAKYLYPTAVDTLPLYNNVIRESRMNSFRKANHISEIDVLNPDGRRYVYGIPVYNLVQRDETFAVDGQHRGNINSGLTGYTPGVDNTALNNRQGKDWYFHSEEIPAYAHSFLLTGILSPDYVDLTGDGISDDDPGDAVKFNYSKVCGVNNPYRWRAPYADTSASGVSLASYNEGLRTESRDDKANYVYGEKELWYLHSIISKTMIATFVVENRLDLLAIDESGHKHADSSAKRLKEIDLYSKADFIKNGTSATPIKTVHFEYDYELCRGVNQPVTDSGKLTLKRIWFTYNGNDKGKQNPYVFNYNVLNPRFNSKAYDRWGNYKDAAQNPGSVFGSPINNGEYPYALQDSTAAAQNAAAWTLDSIYLPSGGAIKVQYESDDYAYVQNKRAMNLFKLAGLSHDSTIAHATNQLYQFLTGDNLYVFVKVPRAVSSKTDVYQQYLTDVSKLYFKLFVRMPDDQYGSGSEYVSCYADLDQGNSYGVANSNTIWVKISGISLAGDGAGIYSPLAKAAIQFLRLNLPSKAYQGSEPGDDLDLASAVKMTFALLNNIKTTFQSFDVTARGNNWCVAIDTSRTYIRLNNPYYKKIGGGYRVRQITIYDKWDKMTGGRAATYGQSYTYTTQQQINGVTTTISSGVASYEPGIGGEENPFHQPIEYVEGVSPLGPTTMGYSEEPLGESVFPAAGVGYSKVRVRTINYKNRKSANGYEETTFYTAYDFPTFTDRSLLDNDTKKRYKPSLANFLRIDAHNYLTLSQGFKIELNDMHGKLRSQAFYPETDPDHYTSYTENFYHVVDQNADAKKLSDVVPVMHPDGSIDTAALIGKDAELMVDMREQVSITNGYNLSPNTDMFSIPFLPGFFVLPDVINLAQREQDQFRSVAVLKVINRYGILDSVIHIDKGSKVSTKDVLYDSETGDVLLTRTQNEFNDPVYTFSYPAHWAYDGMGMAYKNIGLTLQHIYFKEGKIIKGSPAPDSVLFSSGDEILVAGKQATGPQVACVIPFATFPDYYKVWVVDSSLINGGRHCFYFIDKYGQPYNGSDVSLKIVRSGRRNMNGMVGSVTLLKNPMVRDPSTHLYSIVLDGGKNIVNAGSQEFRQLWKVEDIHTRKTDTVISCSSVSCNDTIPATFQDTTISICFAASPSKFYSDSGAYVYSTLADTVGVQIPDTTGFWKNLEVGSDDVTDGRLNHVGIWLCGGCTADTCYPLNEWIGFSQQVYISHTDTFFIGLGSDNQIKLLVDSQLTVQLLQEPWRGGFSADGFPFHRWHIYPVYLTQGYHTFTIQAWNSGLVASFGAEIYDLPRSVLMNANTATIVGNTVFSTDTVASGALNYTSGYSCPVGDTLKVVSGKHVCIQRQTCTVCDTTYSFSCRSLVTDTTVNPYLSGILGNFRGTRSYTYFGPRAETDPSAATDIRHNGTFSSFTPFWAFDSGRLYPQYDTTRWVWNSELTLFNRKGMEVENRDPLGRYNSILYGYNLTLPVAVTQNGRFRETAFEAFEDYGFATQVCDTACPSARHIDFSSYQAKLTTSQKHTGKSSLQLGAGENASISLSLSGIDTAAGTISFHTGTDTCSGVGTVLTGVKASDTIILPNFSPFKGKQMTISAWVKEDQSCTCTSYANNDIKVIFSGGSGTPTFTFTPTGNIIEGWQRFEGKFTIPADATTMTVKMEATGSTTVYFDDLRIHPFNANMKSFVYNPVNLRLMAELDENNHATFYEYDDDGTLIRVKKETERGIQTIKETRSALLKQ